MTLRAAGYAVVADGLDALAFAEQTQPTAVVLDLGLPRGRSPILYSVQSCSSLPSINSARTPKR